MKKSLLLTALLLLSLKCFGQTNSYGAFGAVSFKYTSLLKQNAVLAGGRFGLVINNSIVIGGGYYSLVKDVHTNPGNLPDMDSPLLNFNYGGLELEYIFFSGKPLHFSLSMLLAGGGVYFTTHESNKLPANYFSLDLLAWEPSFNIESTPIDWLHVDLNLSYRMISNFHEFYGLTKNDIKGLSAGLTFKFGRY